jgi:hypothetical protein
MAGVELVLEVPGYHQGAATPGFLSVHSQVQIGPFPFAMKFIRERFLIYHFCLPCRVINEMPMKNWCQYLTLIHCTLSPLFVVFATSTALGKRTVTYMFYVQSGIR